jgi:hypothetical protein
MGNQCYLEEAGGALARATEWISGYDGAKQVEATVSLISLIYAWTEHTLSLGYPSCANGSFVFRHYHGKARAFHCVHPSRSRNIRQPKTWFSAGYCQEVRFPFALATMMDISHDPWLDPLGAVCSEQILALQTRQYCDTSTP